MQLVVAAGQGVLHGHAGAELGVRAQRLPERRIGGEPGSVRGGHVELDEPLALRLGDPQPAVHVDQVREAQLPGEVVRAPERLRLERGEVVDVLRAARAEQRLEQRIGEDAGVEDIHEVTQGGGAPGVLEKSLHAYIITLLAKGAARRSGSRLTRSHGLAGARAGTSGGRYAS